MSQPIVATALPRDNEGVDAAVRVRLESSAVAWQQRRLVLVAGALAAGASHLFGSPVVAAVAVYGIAAAVVIAEAEIALARRSRTEREFDVITLVARVALVTLLAAALTFGGAGTWVTLAVLAALVISIAGSVGTIPMVAVVAYTSLVFVTTEVLTLRGVLAHAHIGSSHPEGHMELVPTLAVALVGFPGLAAIVHLRWRSSVATREELEKTVDELEVARSALEQSQTELEHLNRDLNAAVTRQTSELELRNRYLSVVNAVSTALAEQGNREPLLARATRIAARLLGASAAQGWQSATETEPASSFVLLESEDESEFRELPVALLQRIATHREPLLSDDEVGPDGEPLPDVGGPFAVVPIRSHGESLGAFALIGLDDADIGSRERNLLLSVGRDVGAALMNAAHLHKTEERADRVALLSEMTRLASERRETGEALSAALDLVRLHLDALHVAVVTAVDGVRDVLAVAGANAEHGRDGRYGDRLPGQTAERRASLHRRGAGVMPEEIERRVGTLILAPVIAAVPAVGFEPDEEDASDEHAVDMDQSVERIVGTVVCSAADDGVWDDETVELLVEVAEVVARRLESDAFSRLQHRRIDELGSLAEVARLMQSGADVERLCGGFAQALRTLLPYRGLTIVRASTLGSRAQVHQYDAEGLALPQPPQPADGWSVPALLEPVVWPSELPGEIPQLLASPTATGVALPMLSKGQSLGEVVIGLDGAVDRELLSILEQAVEQLALALDAATLYQQATSRAAQIQTQSNLARIVASQPNLRQAFDEFTEEMRWLVPFDRAALFLVDEAEPGALFQYATAPNAGVVTDVRHPLDHAIAELCAERTEPFLLEQSNPALAEGAWQTLGGGACEAMVVPVRNDGLIALFVLLSDAEPRGAPGDTGVLSEVASLLAVTIERVRLFERSEHMARHDQLTGLPNFRYVQEHLAAVTAAPVAMEATVLMIDMDNLKPFNDLLGHEVGDRVIRIVARELEARSRGGDFVGRVGGDEFVMVMEGVGADEALHVAGRIHRALAEAHLEIDGAPEPVSVSVGVATYPSDASTASDLLREADRAMYAAKALGGGRSALARDRSHRGVAPQSVGRAGRLTDVLLRSATGNATEAERTAIALADRYAGLAAERLGLDVSVLPALRVLVIAASVGRLEQTDRRQEVAVARALLGSVDASTLVDRGIAGQVQAIADGSIVLAWAQTAGLRTTPVAAEEAVRQVDALLVRPEARPAARALTSIVRSDAAERRGNERVA